LAPTHELIFVVVVIERSLDLLERFENEILGVNHTEIEVNGAHESLERILHDVLVGVPPIALTLLIHENELVEPQNFRNLAQSLATDHLRPRLRQKSLLFLLM
jgi:hypothetical protein